MTTNRMGLTPEIEQRIKEYAKRLEEAAAHYLAVSKTDVPFYDKAKARRPYDLLLHPSDIGLLLSLFHAQDAELLACREASKEPFMYGIAEPDGSAYMDECCVGTSVSSIDCVVYGLNQDLDEGEPEYQIIPLYAAPPILAVTVPDGWIKCSERNPEEGGRYWCYVEEQNSLGRSHYQWNCSWNGDEWSEAELSGRITHWMPLASAPKC